MSEVGWGQARETAAACADRMPVVEADLTGATGRVLAKPLRARTALPAFDTAAMDGYACAGPGPWRLLGAAPLTSGAAVAVATGAALPTGADRVLRWEQARARTPGGLAGAVRQGADIRRAGEECEAGELLAPAGAVITPALLGLAAAAGHDLVPVHRQPVLRLTVTGDELLDTGPAGAGRVRDALTPLLVPALEASGAAVTATRCRDDAGALRAALTDPGADVVVVTGSTSRGCADHLRSVLGGLEAEVLVAGVRCRPGHPMLLARLTDGCVVVGLPGNPLAAVAAALTLLSPLLDVMTGHPPRPERWVDAPAIPAHPTDTRLVPVRLDGDAVVPTGGDGSAMLRGLATADAMAVVAPADETASRSRTVRLLDLPGGPAGHRHDGARMLGAA